MRAKLKGIALQSALSTAFIYLTFIGGTFYSDFHLSLRLAHQAIMTAVLAGWLVFKVRRGESLPRTPVDLPLAAYMAAQFLSAVFGISPRLSMERVWTNLVYALLFYLLVDLARNYGLASRLTKALYVSAGAVCTVALMEFACWYFGLPLVGSFHQGWPGVGGLREPIPPYFYRLSFTLSGATLLAAYPAVLIPPAIALALTLPPGDDRQSITAWIPVAFVVEMLSFSRGGVLALMVSLPLLALSFAQSRGGLLAPLGRVKRRHVVYGVLILLLLAVPVSAWLVNSFSNRQYETSFRFQVWRAAILLFAEHPLTGIGPFNFGRGVLRFNSPDFPRHQMVTAHDVYLHTAAELGLVGLVSGGWLLYAFARAWWRAWQGAGDRNTRFLVGACGSALAGMAAHMLVEVYTSMPNVLPILAIAAWVTAGVEPAAVPRPRRYARAAAYGIAVVLAAYMAWFAWLGLAEGHFARSQELVEEQELDAAIAEAERARDMDQSMQLYTSHLAYVHALKAHGGINGGPVDLQAAQKAIEYYTVLLEAEPVYGMDSANLAGVLWQSGRREDAVLWMERTLQPKEEAVYRVNLGLFYEGMGDWERADESYAVALVTVPRLAESGFWDEEERKERWGDIFEKSLALDRVGYPHEIAFYRGDYEAARSLAGEVPPGGHEYGRAQQTLARVGLAEGRPDEAIARMEELTVAEGESGIADCLLGEGYLAKGNEARAEEYLRRSMFYGAGCASYGLGKILEGRGDTEGAIRAYGVGFGPHIVPLNVEAALYARLPHHDTLPQLTRIGVGPYAARSWLELGRLYEEEARFEEARGVYTALLYEDPYFEEARARLLALPPAE